MDSKQIPLKDCCILLTRPERQAQVLAHSIVVLGGSAFVYPSVEIVPLREQSGLLQLVQDLPSIDMLIFVSANAVECAHETLEQYYPSLPSQLKIAAIGPATQAALFARSIPVHICPDNHYSSEALLSLVQLQQVARKRIAIIAGEGGRSLLSEVLIERGAEVIKCAVYRRVKPCNIKPLPSISMVDIVLGTSCTCIENFCEILGDAKSTWFDKITLLVSSERILKRARELGFHKKIILANDATNEAIVTALTEFSLTFKELSR